MPRLPAEDGGLWRHAMRDVAPLRPRSAAPDRGHPGRIAGETQSVQSAPPRPVPSAPPVRPPPPLPLPLPPALPPLDRFAGVDRASAERLKRGRYPVEARLDLHGMTQAEAHRALSGFVARSRSLGRRCVLVITGHGRASGGVLKAAVPRWLGEPDLRPDVLAIAPGQPLDGGSGALYVLLRRLPQRNAC
jgi:DNA-nicking Smr family endonuclease